MLFIQLNSGCPLRYASQRAAQLLLIIQDAFPSLYFGIFLKILKLFGDCMMYFQYPFLFQSICTLKFNTVEFSVDLPFKSLCGVMK